MKSTNLFVLICVLLFTTNNSLGQQKEKWKGTIEDNGVNFYLPLVASANAQQIIENPEKPLSSNAGREVKLEEIFRINDDSSEYYFKYPHNLKVAPDSTLFVLDEGQLLQFDCNGKFVRNYFKRGQGPGEMQYVENYWLTEKNIIINHRRPNKIIWVDYEGKLIKDFRIEQESSPLRFLLYNNDTYYFSKLDFMNCQGEPGYKDVPNYIKSLSHDGKETKELISFPIAGFVARVGGSGGFVAISSLEVIPFQNKCLFLSHTSDYVLKLYDTESKRVIKIFRRKYPKVKTSSNLKTRKKGSLNINGQKFDVPHPDHMNDVLGVFTHKGKLWAITSNLDKKKGFLIDVYSPEGIYEDNFYLSLPGGTSYSSISNLLVSGDYLFRVIRNDEELLEIVKYRIVFED